MSAQPIHKKPPVTDVPYTPRKFDSAPSVSNDAERTLRQIPVDMVEEESMESFPASDPPSHDHSHA